MQEVAYQIRDNLWDALKPIFMKYATQGDEI